MVQARQLRIAGILWIGSLCVGLVLSLGFYSLGRWLTQTGALEPSDRLHGIEIDPPRPAVGFTLAGSDGRQHTLDEFRGQAVLLYFGYLACPDDCPTALAALAQAKQELGTEGSQVQVLWITIDPENDTPERMAEALEGYGCAILGLTGDAADVREIALNYDVDIALKGNGLIEHEAVTLLIDPAGFWRVVYPPGISPEELTVDLSELLKK